MASKGTGFHQLDADWTKGRAQAISDAEDIARRQVAMTRKITMSDQQEKPHE
jgi:hypothetical protein